MESVLRRLLENTFAAAALQVSRLTRREQPGVLAGSKENFPVEAVTGRKGRAAKRRPLRLIAAAGLDRGRAQNDRCARLQVSYWRLRQPTHRPRLLPLRAGP